MSTTAGRAVPTRRRWALRPGSAEKARALAERLGVSPTVAALLEARGVREESDARALLNPSAAQLHDPYLMLGMREATARVLRAIDAGERILIYGDYDVDGTTGTVVLRRALEVLGAKTGYHVPHRFTEGYGIRRDVLERARAEGYGLVISVDCGIRAFEPLEWARDNGLDVIVTDHHLPTTTKARRPPSPCSTRTSAAAGIRQEPGGRRRRFKLAHALFRERGKEKHVPGFLKVVAIGTVADVAQLVGENRAIVSLGLADIHNATNRGCAP